MMEPSPASLLLAICRPRGGVFGGLGEHRDLQVRRAWCKVSGRLGFQEHAIFYQSGNRPSRGGDAIDLAAPDIDALRQLETGELVGFIALGVTLEMLVDLDGADRDGGVGIC